MVDGLCWVLVAVSWAGLILAEAGRFSGAGTLVLAAVLLGSGAFAITKFAKRPSDPGPGQDRTRIQGSSVPTNRPVLEVVLVCAVLALAATIYLHPGEMIFSTHDAGVRLNSAAHLASTGRIDIQDPEFSVAARTGSLGVTLGIYSINADRGLLLPQFSGVSEVWEALALTTVNGLSGLFQGYQEPPVIFPQRMLYLTAMFALASVALLYIVLRQSLVFLVAWTAMTGLALSYPEIYYARIPMSEIIEQLFFVIALYGLVRCWQDGKTRHAVLAGFGVGMTVLTHLDAILVYGAVMIWLSVTVARRQWTRAHTAFAITSGILLIQAGWHDVTYASYYLFTNTMPLVGLAFGSPVAIALIGISVAVWIGFLLAVRSGRLDRIAHSDRTRIGLASVVVAVALAAYFVRPLIQPPTIVYAADGSVSFVHNEGVTWVTVGRYLFPITLLVSLAGIVIALVRRPSRLIWSLLLVSGLYCLFFMVNSFVSPHQPFWIRRFLPVIIPTLVIFAAIAASSPITWMRQRRDRVWSARLFSLALVVLIGSVGQPLWSIEPEFRGALGQTNQFAQALPADSIILADEGPVATWLPLPMTYLFHRDAFVLRPANINDEQLNAAFETWWNRGKTVVFVTDGGRTTLNPDRWGFELIADQAFKFPQLKPDYWIPPTTLQTIEFHATAYRIVPLSQKIPPSFPFTLKTGMADYGYLRTGFQRVDDTGSGAHRWTESEAIVDLPRPQMSQWQLTLRIAGDRPAGVPPARLVVTVDDQLAGIIQFDSIPASRGFDLVYRKIVFPGSSTSPPESGPMRLKLNVNTWRPAEFGLGDVRDLGVAIDDIRLDESN